MTSINVTDETFDEHMLTSELPVVVYFWDRAIAFGSRSSQAIEKAL